MVLQPRIETNLRVPKNQHFLGMHEIIQDELSRASRCPWWFVICLQFSIVEQIPPLEPRRQVGTQLGERVSAQRLPFSLIDRGDGAM